MTDLRRLAVHHAISSHDVAAVGFADRLMPETHAEGRDRPPPATDRLDSNPGLPGRAWSRRQHERCGRERADVLDVDRVVAAYDHLGAKLAQVLDQVVRER